MPELADVTHTMALIYEEKGDLERSFTYGFLSALESRTDFEKWHQCANLATKLARRETAIYCFNRAVKALNKEKDFM